MTTKPAGALQPRLPRVLHPAQRRLSVSRGVMLQMWVFTRQGEYPLWMGVWDELGQDTVDVSVWIMHDERLVHS